MTKQHASLSAQLQWLFDQPIRSYEPLNLQTLVVLFTLTGGDPERAEELRPGKKDILHALYLMKYQ